MLRAWRGDARLSFLFTRRAGRWRLCRCALRRQSVATSTCLIDARLASACTFPQAWAPAGAARAPARAALTASARRGVLRVRRAEGIRGCLRRRAPRLEPPVPVLDGRSRGVAQPG